MANATRNRRPLQPVTGKCRWVRKPGVEDDLSGTFQINGELYAVIFFPTCFEVRKPDGTVYHLPLNLDSCDCPDATYCPERPGGCKHRKALTALLLSIGM